MTMTFPSNCHVYRQREGSRYVTTVFGYRSGCCATGATPEEADRKALGWVTENLKRAGLVGRIGLLDMELSKLLASMKEWADGCEA